MNERLTTWTAVIGVVLAVLTNIAVAVWWASSADTRLAFLQDTVASTAEDVDTLKQDVAALRATQEERSSRPVGVWQ